MVIPMNTSDSKTRRIVGDGKRIIMRTNSDSLLVIGSGNLVEVERNDGQIQVVGDGCKVSVTAGSGSILYTGDGGYLKTGSMDLSKITYQGDGGKIVSNSGTKTSKKSETSGQKDKRSECKTKTTHKDVTVTNKSKFHVHLPSLSNLSNIHVPITKISVINCKCKRS